MKIKIETVASVYSGKAGRCCCGCSGKHRYASAHVKWASKNRGYEVTDKEISDRSVKLLVNKLNKADAKELSDPNPRSIAMERGGRLYVVYFKQ
jgi:hypothetical protein